MNLPVDAVLAALVLLPLAAALVVLVLPRGGPMTGVLVSACMVAAAVLLGLHVRENGPVHHAIGGWGAPLGIQWRADGAAVVLIGTSAVVGAGISLHALGYFAPDPASAPAAARRQQRYFWPVWLMLWGALHALFLSSDLFNLYVTLELLGFAAVSLVASSGAAPALAAAMRYLVVSLLGSLLYLMGVALTYALTATVDIELLGGRVTSGVPGFVALALMTAGLMLKAGLWPLHFWLPPAHSSAPAPVSALLSALVVKGPYFILVRLWLEAFAPVVTPAAANTVGVLGACAIVWGALQALRQERLKQLVAYSTVAQLGYLFLLFPLALHQPTRPLALTGALIFLAAHACAKAAMFLSVGNIMHAAGHDRIKELDGLTHVMPVSVFAFALAGLSLCGLPPSGGFVGKWQLMGAAMRHGHGVQWFWVAVMLGGGLLAAAYVMKVLNHAFTSPDRSAPHAHGSPAMEWTAFAMALLAVGLGLLSAWPAQLLLSSAGGRP